MRNFEIMFKNGQLIDKTSGKRINLKPFETYYLQGDDRSFLLEDYIKIEYQPLNSEDKIKALDKAHSDYILEKIAATGDRYMFRIGLAKRFDEDEVREYLFDAILEEDLYLKKKIGGIGWTLCSCICRSETLLDGYLGFEFQTVQANSLSQLFGHVVSTYFNMKRSTACNAFQIFYKMPNDKTPSLRHVRYGETPNLDAVRAEVSSRKNADWYG